MIEPTKLVIKIRDQDWAFILKLVKDLLEEGIHCYYESDGGVTYPVTDGGDKEVSNKEKRVRTK